ncbi:DUF4279 domain-containing protein [Flavobacterium sp. PL02]|uniref:DUF4279 domain-containing protein n=1 Tax=Flavobacterium sp. PL02 TaxID=3088354 RepID=UPI002B22ECE2|nr:DUF4279 domain-containing protein [Flavobacterium sp. PL02]MEA9411476.1 DUF4279 domain-containing protein [Flavobacterium sp. PL02]
MVAKTHIKLIFSIYGDVFNLNEFTELVGISPTACWNKGDLIKNNKKEKKRLESAWEYSINNIDTIYFEEISDEYVKLFIDKVDKILVFSENNKLTIKFDIVLEIVKDNGVVMSFNRNFLAIVNKLDAEIEVDTYILD